MGLSIITPHFNNSRGIKKLFILFQKQTDVLWEWIIVDDCSSETDVKSITKLLNKNPDNRIKFIVQQEKTNASECRNLGARLAVNKTMVFLDCDDFIHPNFVSQRKIENKEFAVFKNMDIRSANGSTQPFSEIQDEYLNHFLKARFPWQTTAMVWDREFFRSLGGFNDKLSHFQDVELAIKALMLSKNYDIKENNEIDFEYQVYPIDPRKRPIQTVAPASVEMIRSILKTGLFKKRQIIYLQSYYYVCVRYWLKGGGNKNSLPVMYVTLRDFNHLRIISFWKMIAAKTLLQLYVLRILSSKHCLSFNRRLFKY